MKKNLLLIVFVILALVIGVYTYAQKSARNQKAATEVNSDMTSPEPENNDSAAAPEGSASAENWEKKAYTLDQIAMHDNKEDCWFAIGDKVYDVTGFIAGGKHGGGDAIVEGCGKDATNLFETRPMGSGTPHSDEARSFLPNFEIGTFTK